MTGETKIEIVVFGGVAAILAFVWLSNRNAGAGSGLSGVAAAMPFSGFGFAGGGGGAASPVSTAPAGILPTIAAVPGQIFNYLGGGGNTMNEQPGAAAVAAIAANAAHVSAAQGMPGGSGCGCGCSGGAGGGGQQVIFASPAAQAAQIAAAPIPENVPQSSPAMMAYQAMQHPSANFISGWARAQNTAAGMATDTMSMGWE